MLRRGFLKRIGAGCAGLWLGMGLAKLNPPPRPVDVSDAIPVDHWRACTAEGRVIAEGHGGTVSLMEKAIRRAVDKPPAGCQVGIRNQPHAIIPLLVSQGSR